VISGIFEDQLPSLLNFDGFPILELRSRDREAADLAGVTSGGHSEHRRCFGYRTCIRIVDHYKILHNYVFSCTYSVEIIEDIIDKGLIPNGDIALL
jgi:hypothetical protein